jgi:small nuclear ribonucleoprotein D1
MNLNLIFKKILNETITVELKNETLIYGTLIKFDKSMNLYLKNVKKSFPNQKSIFFASVSIRGSIVRYIIIPDWINLDLILLEK